MSFQDKWELGYGRFEKTICSERSVSSMESVEIQAPASVQVELSAVELFR
jgi:hypothetical protein